MKQVPPFFIVGSGRSGTTLLRRLLDRHPLVCVPEETHFIPHLYKPFLRHIGRGRPEQALALINSQPLVRQWGIHLNVQDLDTAAEGEQVYARAIDLLMRRKAEKEGKRYWGEKSPEYVHQIALLARLFPKARFIHIYRDGRDVAISVMPLKWGPNNAWAAARWWAKAIHAWQTALPKIGHRGMEICYEKFVRNPEEELRRVCDFLGLSYAPVMLDGYPITTDRMNLWRNNFYMSAKERTIFEAIAGETLQALGYERSVENARISPWVVVFSALDEAYRRVSNRLLRQ